MKLKKRISEIREFLERGIWKMGHVEGVRGLLYRWLRIIIITAKEFTKDKIVLKASAVAYLSILSVVPIVAMIFGISKGFGLEISIQSELAKLMPGQEVVMNQTFIFAQKMLDNAKGGVIAGISILVLFFTVMRLLNNVEAVFNSIWGEQTSRTWLRKFTDYLAIVTVAPILIIVSSSLTVFMATQIQGIGERFELVGYVTPFVQFLIQLSSYILIWLLFTLVYVIMPNTKVRFTSGIVGGVIGGTMFQFVQWGFINFQVGVASYNTIYGSLAALPLFFIFTQLSWTIVFIGGEISYAFQAADTYIPDEKNIKFSALGKKKIALVVLKSIVKSFEKGDKPYNKRQLSENLDIPHRFVSDAINHLVSSGVLTKSIAEKNERHVYLPSIDINKLDIQYVTHKLDEHGIQDFYANKNGSFESINQSLATMNEQLDKSSANKLLKDL